MRESRNCGQALRAASASVETVGVLSVSASPSGRHVGMQAAERGGWLGPCFKLVTVTHPHARPDITCRNCGAAAPLNFCPACGQETALHPPTLGEFLHEFIGHYVALEGALWRTLALLLFRPGRLTREYLEGRRRRYVLPLRLYLTASFVFFLVIKLLPATLDQAIQFNGSTAEQLAAEASMPASAASSASPAASAASRNLRAFARPADCGLAGERNCGPIEGAANRVARRFHDDSTGAMHVLRVQLIGAAPYTIFLLLPVFAGIVMLALRNRRMTYGEHVVFSLHLHAFWFLALLPVALLPTVLSDIVQWFVPIYGVWAIREVYRGGWGSTLLRALFITTLYGAVLIVTTLGLVGGLLAMT